VTEPVIELAGLGKHYGDRVAVDGLSFAVPPGQIVGLVGPNGAGKTTTLRAVSGTVRRGGTIVFAGRELRREGPETVARLGIAHVPEGRGTFSELTVWENLRLGAFTRRGSLDADAKRVLALFPWLEGRRNQQAGTLSGGEQQMLAIGRAMMQRPRLLMVDEPSLGLAPLVVTEIFRVLKELNDQEGMAVLLVEQNARNSLEASHRAYLLETGRVVLDGESDELARHEGVRRSYLGY
jgi:branched-chain amino acid transport system ATP-binding protein